MDKLYSFWQLGRYDAVTQNEFRGLDFICNEDDLKSDGSGCPFTSGEQVIDELNLYQLEVWQDMLILIALVSIFQFHIFYLLYVTQVELNYLLFNKLMYS